MKLFEIKKPWYNLDTTPVTEVTEYFILGIRVWKKIKNT